MSKIALGALLSGAGAAAFAWGAQNMEDVVVATLLAMLCFALWSVWLAGRKARDKATWFVAGALLGPIAVLALTLADQPNAGDQSG